MSAITNYGQGTQTVGRPSDGRVRLGSGDDKTHQKARSLLGNPAEKAKNPVLDSLPQAFDFEAAVIWLYEKERLEAIAKNNSEGRQPINHLEKGKPKSPAEKWGKILPHWAGYSEG
jgi:hypothetical protein